MPFDFAPVSLGRQFLASHKSLFLDDAEGVVITVESGTVWVTMENDTRDIVLVPGMRFEIDRSGRTIVAAEEDTRLRLFAPRDCVRDCVEGAAVAVRVGRKFAAWLERWAPLRKSGYIPYY